VSPVTQYVVQAAVTLLGVALLAYLIVTANRRWGAVAGRGPLELLGRLPLEGRRAVYMVRVNNRVLVLAATDQQITKVADLPDDGVTSHGVPSPRFSDVLRRLTQRPAESSASEPNDDGARPSPPAPWKEPSKTADPADEDRER